MFFGRRKYCRTARQSSNSKFDCLSPESRAQVYRSRPNSETFAPTYEAHGPNPSARMFPPFLFLVTPLPFPLPRHAFSLSSTPPRPLCCLPTSPDHHRPDSQLPTPRRPPSRRLASADRPEVRVPISIPLSGLPACFRSSAAPSFGGPVWVNFAPKSSRVVAILARI